MPFSESSRKAKPRRTYAPFFDAAHLGVEVAFQVRFQWNREGKMSSSIVASVMRQSVETGNALENCADAPQNSFAVTPVFLREMLFARSPGSLSEETLDGLRTASN